MRFFFIYWNKNTSRFDNICSSEDKKIAFIKGERGGGGRSDSLYVFVNDIYVDMNLVILNL